MGGEGCGVRARQRCGGRGGEGRGVEGGGTRRKGSE